MHMPAITDGAVRLVLAEAALDAVLPEWKIASLVAAVGRVRWEKLSTHGDFLPEVGKILRCLSFVPPDDIKFVIIGQDPYPQDGKANGLAFGIARGYARGKVKDSLSNIIASAGADPATFDTTMEGWARQGVLLLNTCLTVAPGWAGSHVGLGWEEVVAEILSIVKGRAPDAVWMLWGRAAKNLVFGLPGASPRAVRISSHPSPMSADRAMGAYPSFLSARMFRRSDPINWTGSE